MSNVKIELCTMLLKFLRKQCDIEYRDIISFVLLIKISFTKLSCILCMIPVDVLLVIKE